YNNNLFFKISSNDIDNEEPTSVFSSEISSSNKQQKVFSRPFNPI
ncbi:1886_t:CDS:1, partial [Racocetra persica]